MRIGILTPSIYMYRTRFADRIFAPGDLARHLVRGLARRGHEVHWFSAPEEVPQGVTLHAGDETLLTKDLKMRVFQDMSPDLVAHMSLYGTKMYYESDLVSRAYDAFTQKKLDCIHNFHSFGYLAHFYEELTHAPIVYTLHDPMPTGDMLEAWLFARFPTHKFISLSDSQRGTFASHFVATVYNGVDTAAFPFSANEGHGFISVGRLIAQKGHDIAIVAAKEAGVPLTIASWVTDTIQESTYYKEKIAPFIDDKSIVLYSLLRGQNLASKYQAAQGLLFPLQWEEPFGLVMVEAMSCGTPVIAFNRGSVAEIVKDGVTGFVVDPAKGIAGLVDAMKHIGEIDRAACRKHVEENFSIEKMVDGYEGVYKKTLANVVG